ncbi:hypothetical protein HWV62_27577 [Athelia sp. TMB]|nr:hypothetical protein HWV62_27577 [Athelia sp. TMB]
MTSGVEGMWGNSSHLAEAANALQHQFPAPAAGSEDPEVEVYLCQSNHEQGTYDGVDWGGERAVDEIDEKVKAIEESGRHVTRFSITGYSLGGLVARYIVGILRYRGFFEKVTPVNFTTIATPNIGLLRYSTVFSTVAHNLGPTLLGRTGSQFYGKDSYADTGKSLVEVMSEKNGLFYKALASFVRVGIYANGIHDLTVPYVSAAFEPYDPFCTYDGKNLDLVFEDDCEYMLKSYRVKDKQEIAMIPVEPKPKQSIGEWLSSKKPAPIPGPFFEWRFPMHLIWLMILPITLPIFLIGVPTHFALSSRSSNARVKLLESDEESMTRRLIGAWAKLEAGFETAVEEIAEEVLPSSQPPAHSEQEMHSGIMNDDGTPASPKDQPKLTPAQHRMIANLNTLPNMTKRIVFIHPARNSHAIIVCRSPERVSEHRKGEGVLRIWAREMVL